MAPCLSLDNLRCLRLEPPANAAGRCSEAERDRIEEQVGKYMRSCTDNIARLEASVNAEKPGSRGLNAHMVAHRHGVVGVPSVTTHFLHYHPSLLLLSA